jgi:transcriptional regulator with XRE-family HTH domain
MAEETMGERLKRLRQAAGLTQAQLADRVGLSLGAVRNWEQDRRVPLFDAAIRAAQAMGVSLDVLAGLAEPQAKPTKPRKGR